MVLLNRRGLRRKRRATFAAYPVAPVREERELVRSHRPYSEPGRLRILLCGREAIRVLRVRRVRVGLGVAAGDEALVEHRPVLRVDVSEEPVVLVGLLDAELELDLLAGK